MSGGLSGIHYLTFLCISSNEITGSGDPRVPLEDTLEGKLPQRKITTEAALGYSSYGNQIGLPGGYVSEIYDEGYVAKRMELGAVVAAAPRKNVVRGQAEPGDVIVLVGGRTGRDGWRSYRFISPHRKSFPLVVRKYKKEMHP